MQVGSFYEVYALKDPSTNVISGNDGLSFSFWVKPYSAIATGLQGKIFDFGNGATSDNIFMGIYSGSLYPDSAHANSPTCKNANKYN